jgi:hypothetical protein
MSGTYKVLWNARALAYYGPGHQLKVVGYQKIPLVQEHLHQRKYL